MIMPTLKHARASRAALYVLLVLSTALVIFAGSACISEDDLTIDQRAHQLSQQLMCPVCDGQTLDQSQAQISEDMKAVVREKLETGETNQEIRTYFVERYGELVLAAPTTSGFSLVAWAMPLLIFLAGVLVVINAMRRMRSKPATLAANVSPSSDDVPEPESDEDDLTEYLKRVDAEIASYAHSSTDNANTSRN